MTCSWGAPAPKDFPPQLGQPLHQLWLCFDPRPIFLNNLIPGAMGADPERVAPDRPAINPDIAGFLPPVDDAGGHALILPLAMSTYCCSRSMPMKANPSNNAALPVLPDPMNGSNTMPSGGVTSRQR